MPGFDCSRFVNLSEGEKKWLICSICFNIFDNAINSKCGHTFCKLCIQEWIANNHEDCPNCRQQFERAKRSNGVNTNLIIIGNNVFTRNLVVNSMVSELQIECNYKMNGCPEIIGFSLLSNHLKRCEYRLCEICGFIYGKSEEHNCLQFLLRERNQLIENKNQFKLKYETNEKTVTQLTADIIQIKEYHKKEIYSSHLKAYSAAYILFGNYRVVPKSVYLNLNGLRATELSANRAQKKLTQIFDINIIFNETQELMYCSNSLLWAIIIKPTTSSCLKIKQILKLEDYSSNDFKFDVNSEDSKHWYIVLVFKDNISDFVNILDPYLKRFEPQISVKQIEVKTTQQLISKQLVKKTQTLVQRFRIF